MTALSDREYRRAFYQAVDVQQGLDPRREFYVPIYSKPGMERFDLVPKMQDAIELSAGQSLQLLSGFRGCGKTSELLRLMGELKAQGAITAYMDIEDYFNTLLPLDASRLPFALAAGFARAIDRDPNRGPMRRFFDFVKRVRPDLGLTVGVEGAELDIRAVIRDDTSFAAEMEATYKMNRRVLREQFHAFFAGMLEDLDSTQPVVFMVDSIDHWRGASDQFDTVRDSVEQAFTELAPDLRIPNMHVIYTVPIYLDMPWLETRNDVVNIKLAARTGERYEPGHEALRDVLARRAPGGELSRLLPDALLERIIASSGGQFRDLMRLCRLTILEANGLPATEESVQKAEMSVRNGYATTLTEEQLTLLGRVHATKEAFTPREQSSDEAALVTLGAILRYPNDTQTWFDVHPLLVPLLR